MKLSVSTLGCPDKTLPEAIALLSSCGIRGLEIRGLSGKMRAEDMTCFAGEELPRSLALMKDAGIVPVGFGTSVQLHDAAKFDENTAEGRAAIDLCRRAGIPAIRVFGNDLPEKDGRDEAIAVLLRQANLLCDYAEDAGVGVNLEIHGTINTIENLIPVLDGMCRRPSFGLIWDVMHTDRAYGDKWEPVYKLIRPFIRHVHIKDHERNSVPPFHQVPLGEGDIPLEKIVGRLLSDGYDGWFSLEWERAWHPDLAPAEEVFPQFVEYMKRFE